MVDYSQYKQFELRRRFFKIVGAEITISDPVSQQEVGFIKMAAWKLREDIRIFVDRSQQETVVQIHARQIIDFGATYDVSDALGQKLFALRRKGFKSALVRDHWNLLDPSDQQFGEIQETSSGLALARRWLEVLPFGDFIGLLFSFIPQTYTVTVNGQLAANITHRKNPVIVKMLVDTSAATVASDPRIVLTSAAMLSIIDAVKNN